MSDNDRLIEALRQVPEVRLRLIDLAWGVFEHGTINPQKLTLHAKELGQATDEASAYSKQTREMVWALKKLALS